MATAYCGTSDLNRWYEGFVLRAYGTYSAVGGDFPSGTVFGTEVYDDMQYAFNEVNAELRSLAKVKDIPVGTQSDGNYPPSLIKWNSQLTIYNKLRARHNADHESMEIPPFIVQYLDECTTIRNGIMSGDIVFDEDISLAESGIGQPEIIDWGTFGTGWMPISNWNTGDSYLKSDEDIWYYFTSTQTNVLTTATCATFTVKRGSPDLAPIGTIVAGVDGAWTDVEYGLKIRVEIDQPKNIGGTIFDAVEGTVANEAQFRVRCVSRNITSHGASGYVKAFSIHRG